MSINAYPTFMVFLAILLTAAIAMILLPFFIRLMHYRHIGQQVRADGPQRHLTKQGTPTMGGIVILVALSITTLALGGTDIATLLVLIATLLTGVLGFIDDFAKVRKKQNEGLTVKGKFIGQFILATIYAVLALMLPTKSGFPSAQAGMSFIETPFLSFDFAGRFLAIVLFVIWVNFLMAAWTNAVNLTDGLDGLCAGSSMVAFAGYGIIAFWESYHLRGSGHPGFTYAVSDPFDLTVIACCAAVACLGFLWYNCNPASIFMGDTGSLALGGLFAAMSIATHTEFLAIILGGLFVIETLSDIIQVGYFKMTHKRVFKMAPIHHHFELCGWTEGKVVVRFWMVELMFVIIGLMIFYTDWVVRSGL